MSLNLLSLYSKGILLLLFIVAAFICNLACSVESELAVLDLKLDYCHYFIVGAFVCSLDCFEEFEIAAIYKN